ncbi:hypothetical protein [Jonesia quinghaiensis]|uniref:hypothetical protein n=1 Tax=Jonesia quinghaiensis TaxID=262806 RepID=UPI0004914A75|nr:hypothetical protein [Jonesia quinghaiensis]
MPQNRQPPSRWVIIASVIALSAGLSSCSDEQREGRSDQQPGGVVGETIDPELDYSYKAVIDRASGTVRLPLDVALGFPGTTDHFSESSPEESKYMVACLTKAGYPHTYEPERDSLDTEWYYFGPWVEGNVERWGYAGPPSPSGDADTTFSVVQPGPGVREKEGYPDAVADCVAAVAVTGNTVWSIYTKLPEPVTMADSDAIDFATSSDTYREVIGEWRECIEGNGLEMVKEYTGSGWIEGVDLNVLDEKNIRAAVVDVQCKDEVNYMQRILDVAAAYQGPIVEKYEAELADASQQIADHRREVKDSYLTWLSENP